MSQAMLAYKELDSWWQNLERQAKTKVLSAKTKMAMGHPVQKDRVQKDEVQQKSN